MKIFAQRTGRLTIRNGLNATTTSKQVSTDNTNVNGQCDDTSPPANNIANKINLFLSVVFSPETDPADEERPVDRAASIWV